VQGYASFAHKTRKRGARKEGKNGRLLDYLRLEALLLVKVLTVFAKTCIFACVFAKTCIFCSENKKKRGEKEGEKGERGRDPPRSKEALFLLRFFS